MADANSTNAPPLTRFVRASALLTMQAAGVGFGINTARFWARLPEFVTSNKMSIAERTSILLWLILPALVWVTFAYAEALVRIGDARRISALEHRAQRWSWLAPAGVFPVLVHPTLWHNRTLMFLLSTGILSLVAWWASRLTLLGWQRGAALRSESDVKVLGSYLARLAPAQLRSVAPLFILGLGVIYVVMRGIWLDPTAVPLRSSDPPVSVLSLRQGFQILGHGGWLGLPIVGLKFLRPPGHAHVFFWALCIASAAFPLYAWAKRHLGSGIALVVALSYLSMPSLRTIGRGEVVPLGVAAGLFFLAALHWERKNFRAAVLTTLLTVGVHEQAALWFCCLGIYWSITERSATWGRSLAIGAGVYFVVMAMILLPQLDLDLYQNAFRGIWGSRPVGLLETVKVSLTNPPYVLSRWVELQGPVFWLAIFVPFAFLPLIGKNWLLWVIPGITFAIVAAGRCPGLPVAAGAVSHFIVLGFAASVTNLARLRAFARTRRHAEAAVVTWVFSLAPCLYQLGGLFFPAP